LDLQTPRRLSEKIIERSVFQGNVAWSVGVEMIVRSMCGVEDENEVTMQGGASILSPALVGSVYDWIGNAGCITRRGRIFV
jgi:hypothetical protein